MHSSARLFVERIALRYPDHFTGVRVLEIGSQNINGSVRNLFADCRYIGIDVAAGPGVDLVCTAGDLSRLGYKAKYDTIISTECLEHDALWQETLDAITSLLKSGGLMCLTMATTGRAEHGTKRSMPGDCPGIPWNYYRNLTEADIRSVLNMDEEFAEYGFEIGGYDQDLYVWGIKR